MIRALLLVVAYIAVAVGLGQYAQADDRAACASHLEADPTSPDMWRRLGIPRGSSAEDARKAFLKLAMKYHPDRQGGDTLKFQNLEEAQSLIRSGKIVEYERRNQTAQAQSAKSQDSQSKSAHSQTSQPNWQQAKSDFFSQARANQGAHWNTDRSTQEQPRAKGYRSGEELYHLRKQQSLELEKEESGFVSFGTKPSRAIIYVIENANMKYRNIDEGVLAIYLEENLVRFLNLKPSELEVKAYVQALFKARRAHPAPEKLRSISAIDQLVRERPL